MDNAKKPQIPLPTIRRYPVYLRAIKAKMAAGDLLVSSAVLAAELGFDPVLTRKDLAMSGVSGRPRRGYPARELCEAINRALGWDDAIGAALVGVGMLGKALLGYSGFEEQNLNIAAAFDVSPDLVGENIHGVKVRMMSEMAATIAQMRLSLAILTVPASAAQECADRLCAAGIRGILNFSSVVLSVPKRVVVQNVDLAQSLAVLSHSISRR